MRSSPWRWPLLLVLANAFVGVIVVGDTWVKQSMEGENLMLISEMGAAQTTQIHERAIRWYTDLFVKNGVVENTFRGLVPADADDKPLPGPSAQAGKLVFSWAKDRIQVFWTLVYQALLRLSLAVTWIPVGLCLIVPAMIDGYSRRKIKQSNFDIASPDRFGFAVLAMQLMIAGYILVMFLPFPLPPFAPLVCFALTALCARTLLSNLHKNI